MCDKIHYDDLVEQVEEIKKLSENTFGEMQSLREDANISLSKFIKDIEVIRTDNQDYHEKLSQRITDIDLIIARAQGMKAGVISTVSLFWIVVTTAIIAAWNWAKG